MLTYCKCNSLEVVGIQTRILELVDYMKPIARYILMLVGGPISWKSVRQTITASITMHTEFISYHEATSQVIWLRNFSM